MMQTDELKFIVDHNAGKLSKWLRMAGFDALLFRGADDAAMIARASSENRILLTRDRRIMKRRAITRGEVNALLVTSDQPEEQVRQVLADLRLAAKHFRPFTICLKCNNPLEERAKETIKERLPPYVFLTQEQFAECPACRRLYWQGTHWQAMHRTIDEFLCPGPK